MSVNFIPNLFLNYTPMYCLIFRCHISDFKHVRCIENLFYYSLLLRTSVAWKCRVLKTHLKLFLGAVRKRFYRNVLCQIVTLSTLNPCCLWSSSCCKKSPKCSKLAVRDETPSRAIDFDKIVTTHVFSKNTVSTGKRTYLKYCFSRSCAKRSREAWEQYTLLQYSCGNKVNSFLQDEHWK